MTPTLTLLLALQIAAPATDAQAAPSAAEASPQAEDASTGRTGPAVATSGGDIVVTARRRNESV